MAKITKRRKAALDIFYARFDASLLFRLSGWQGIDEKAVAFGQVLVGSLHGWIKITGFGDGTLGIVDHHPFWHAAEELKGVAVTHQPGVDQRQLFFRFNDN